MTARSWISSWRGRCSGSSRCSPTSPPTLTVQRPGGHALLPGASETADPCSGRGRALSFVIGGACAAGSSRRRSPRPAPPTPGSALGSLVAANGHLGPSTWPRRGDRTRAHAWWRWAPIRRSRSSRNRDVPRPHDRPGNARRRGPPRDVRRRGPPLPRRRRGGRIGVVTDTDLMGLGRDAPDSRSAAQSNVPDRRGGGHRAGSSRPRSWRPRGHTHRPNRRRARDRARRRRADRPVAPPDARAPRGPAVRVGLARARERGSARAGAAHRSGSRARLRPDPGTRRRPVLRRRSPSS